MKTLSDPAFMLNAGLAKKAHGEIMVSFSGRQIAAEQERTARIRAYIKANKISKTLDITV